jgi:2,3-bisphosphoglycerate-independent phosphoglycerate mutase
MLQYVKQTGRTLHIMGLLSDGGVHAHINHLKAILDMCRHQQVKQVMIHVFTDGRDTDPKSGLGFLTELAAHLPHSVGQIASVTGRYYAMDRDKRWERVKIAYDALVHGVGTRTANIISAVEDVYAHGVTDEFIQPLIACDENGNALATLQDGDAVFCFNFRTDRCREITQVLTQEAFHEYNMQPLSLHYTTLTVYDKTFRNIHTIFRQDDLKNTLGEVLSNAGKTQIRIAETEKYPHVTFFFNGGREAAFDGESRILCPSPKEVATYDQKPEMSAYDITEAILPEIEKATTDFICLNFANADMVGHTGVWNAVIQAVETVDRCVERIVTLALQKGYTIFLTADHGNSDYMINEDGTPNTAHTLNPVPLFLISPDNPKPIRNGKLGDLAPTILHIMDIPVPDEMTGDILC